MNTETIRIYYAGISKYTGEYVEYIIREDHLGYAFILYVFSETAAASHVISLKEFEEAEDFNKLFEFTFERLDKSISKLRI